MDGFSEKQAARSKWRSTQHLKRVHGGRGRGRGPHHHTQQHHAGQELESNYDRYQLSDDEAGAEGELVRQSQGGDLAQLLEENEQFYAQAHYRYRSFIDTSSKEPPPVDIAALEQELAIEVEPLMRALSLLPLSDVLCIRPELLLQYPSPSPSSLPQRQQQQQQQQQQPAKHQLSTQQGQVQQQQVQVQQPQPQSQQQPSVSDSRLPPFFRPAEATQAASTATPVAVRVAPSAGPAAQAAVPQAATAPVVAGGADDDDDEELLRLLTADSSIPAAPAVAPAAAATALPTQHPTASHISSSQPVSSSVSPTAQAFPAATAATRQSVRGVEAAHDADDPLDMLLTGTSSTGGQAQAAAGARYGKSGSSKKQSLEEWLDGF